MVTRAMVERAGLAADQQGVSEQTGPKFIAKGQAPLRSFKLLRGLIQKLILAK
jgi:hypothetical protein